MPKTMTKAKATRDLAKAMKDLQRALKWCSDGKTETDDALSRLMDAADGALIAYEIASSDG